MYCPNCGKEYIEGQNFCRYCGYSLADNNIEEVVEMQNNSAQDINIKNNNLSSVEPNKNISSIHSSTTDEDEHEAYSKLIDKKKRLTPKAIAIITITIVCMIALGLLLFSIDVETQIGGSSSPVIEETDNDFEINTPADEENSIYAKEPVDVESHAVQIVSPVEPPVINEEAHENSELSVKEPVFDYADEHQNEFTESHTNNSDGYNEQERNFEPYSEISE